MTAYIMKNHLDMPALIGHHKRLFDCMEMNSSWQFPADSIFKQA
jgi:hypothetical protein